MKIIKLLLTILILSSCQSTLLEDGFYVGSYQAEETVNYYLTRFQSGKMIQYGAIPDTFRIVNIEGNTYKLIDIKNPSNQHNWDIQKEANEINFLAEGTDSIAFKIEKARGDNFALHTSFVQGMNISLPSAYGRSGNYEYEIDFFHPMYVFKSGEKTFINFNDSTVALEYLASWLSDFSCINVNAYWFGSVSLVADKNITYTTLSQIKKNLCQTGFHQISYMLSTSEYDMGKQLSFKIGLPGIFNQCEPDYTVCKEFGKPPPPRPPKLRDVNTLKNSNVIISIIDKEILLNGVLIDSSTIYNQLQNEITSKESLVIGLYFDPNTSYEMYINTLGLIQKSMDQIRNRFIDKRIKSETSELDINEVNKLAREKYPLRLIEINRDEYSELIN